MLQNITLTFLANKFVKIFSANLYFCHMTPIEIKAYFDQNPPPPTFDFKPWAKITDCEKFLQSCYSELANFNGPYEKSPGYWRLKEFYITMVNLRKEAK